MSPKGLLGGLHFLVGLGILAFVAAKAVGGQLGHLEFTQILIAWTFLMIGLTWILEAK